MLALIVFIVQREEATKQQSSTYQAAAGQEFMARLKSGLQTVKYHDDDPNACGMILLVLAQTNITSKLIETMVSSAIFQ